MIAKRRVLIVDDERAVADTLAVVFSFNGYVARAVYSAEEALAMVADYRPELAIIDVYLPGMNGINLATLLIAGDFNLRVFLFSGQPGAMDLIAAAGHSFELLVKPVHPSEILSMAARLLNASPEDSHEVLPN